MRSPEKILYGGGGGSRLGGQNILLSDSGKDASPETMPDRPGWTKVKVLKCKVSKQMHFRTRLEEFFEGVFQGGGERTHSRAPNRI